MNTTANTNFFSKLLTKRHFLTVAILVVALGAIWLFAPTLVALLPAADEATESPMSVKPLPVNVAKIESISTYRESRRFAGTIRARQSAELAFEIPGRLETVAVEEGDTVKEGQVLATIDTNSLDAQKIAAVAGQGQAESVLAELQAGPRKQSIDSAKAQVAAAASEFERAKINLNRRRESRKTGAITIDEYDQAVFTRKTSLANLESARQRLAELVAGTRSEKIQAQEAVVKMSEAAIAQIDVTLAKCKIIAPFSGKVTRRFLDPGTIAAATAPVIRIVEQSHLEARVGVPISVASKLGTGDQTTVFVDQQPYAATVKAKISELDAATRTQSIVFTLDPSASDSVISGQLCEVAFENELEGSGYWIPNSALAKGVRGLWSVMVVVESGAGMFRAENRDVEIIRSSEQRVLVRGTINPGDVIVVDGIHRITAGQLVAPNSSKADLAAESSDMRISE